MKFIVSLDRDEDGVWIAECPSIPGCVSQGNTREEALENVKEAIELCLQVRAEHEGGHPDALRRVCLPHAGNPGSGGESQAGGD
jgi:predicted RNase H-like HicB family nuclease